MVSIYEIMPTCVPLIHNLLRLILCPTQKQNKPTSTATATITNKKN